MAKKEYVEQEVLTVENLEKYITVMEVNTREFGQQTVIAVDDLRYLPTVDVQNVKHGEWIKSNEHINFENGKVAEWTNFYCSECDAPNTFPTKCCPECGAKMKMVGEQE